MPVEPREGEAMTASHPAPDMVAPAPADLRPLQIEANGINVISDAERKGRPRDLFWPWFAANVSVLGLSYGAFVLAFGISFWQALIAGLAGIIVSFLLCGFISVAGKRGSVPTMVLGRAAFGVRGNKLPALLSWLLTVGWETVLIILATLATATVFGRLGWGSGTATKVIALIIVTALVVLGGVMGFDLIMRMQTVITVVTAVLTVVFIALVADKIDWHTVSSIPSGSAEKVIGGLVFVMTGFGLGWVNVAADYSRYLPRRASGRGVIGWTTFGSSVAPVFLVVFGLLLAGSSAKLSSAIGADPIGALTQLLPTWFLVPFAIVAVLGLVGGAVLDIYSSGLALLTVGLPAPRFVAALIDGTVMIAGTIYVVFVAGHFLNQFEGFLITLGVPIAAWCGIMLADIALRRRDYSEPDLYLRSGRYGDIRLLPLAVIVVATAAGWGLVTNTYASWLTWQGYLLGPAGLGGKTGNWAYANLGVLVALVLGFVAALAYSGPAIRAQETAPALAPAAAGR
jgi:nucleobase:cation symporter-1, NCS1 family